jgi:hypothetical protein
MVIVFLIVYLQLVVKHDAAPERNLRPRRFGRIGAKDSVPFPPLKALLQFRAAGLIDQALARRNSLSRFWID